MTSAPELNKLEHMSYKWIRASEVSDYLYCNRAWWLKRARGMRPRETQALRRGTRYHQQHGRTVRRASWLRGVAYVLVFLAIALLVFQLVNGV